MVGNKKLFWVGLVAALLIAGAVSAQSVDVFGPAAKIADQARLSQSIGKFAMVIFAMVAACAFWFKKIGYGVTAVFLVIGTVIWYQGGDIAQSIFPTSGSAIAP